jgi:hypothetical protein
LQLNFLVLFGGASGFKQPRKIIRQICEYIYIRVGMLNVQEVGTVGSKFVVSGSLRRPCLLPAEL